MLFYYYYYYDDHNIVYVLSLCSSSSSSSSKSSSCINVIYYNIYTVNASVLRAAVTARDTNECHGCIANVDDR